MPPPRSSTALVRGLAASLLLLLGGSGCDPAARGVDHLSYAGSGTLSDTVLPPLSESFVRRGGVPLTYDGYVGSSAGFAAAMKGQVMLSGVARALKSSEKAQHPYYVIIGYDALAIFVHPDNPVASLSRAQLKELFTGKARSWKDVGGADVPVERVTTKLATGSGTADFFREKVLEGAAFAPAHEIADVREMVAYVAAHPRAIAFGSLSVPPQGVRAVQVEGVAPTADSVRTADYLLSRPLVLATREVPEGPLQAFLDHVMSPEGQAIVARSFVPVHVSP
ncbi:MULTISPECIES: phosphate ABC transporter substrate-binding protein [Myxococcaceae]|uniref:phosphate ABC transporter substrate-binding protein n=1 Tax=Myxococcaceae TaxID=31 RepID=UPI00129D1CE7|nr:phosphate ABC transporter substrate-binding protein [Simulacricoccus sp. 17bor-14]